MILHWHKVNPWRDRAVYVPLEKLAACVAGGTVNDQGVIKPYNVEWLLDHWHQCGRDKLDAYLLPQPGMAPCCGVRYGAEGSEYYSPHNANVAHSLELLAQHKGQWVCHWCETINPPSAESCQHCNGN